jgi:pSer/pThr/pTyr-binding forkhead associated (FHA) protein
MELLVVAGADAGNRFTLEGSEILLGRGQPESGVTDVVRLVDKSISRKQAWIRRDDGGTSIEHIARAPNPTLINGEEIDCVRLSPGDRIEIGRVAIDVRAREGMNLSGLTELMEGAARESTGCDTTLSAGPGPSSQSTVSLDATRASAWPASQEQTLATLGGELDEPTELRPMDLEIGRLELVEGPGNLIGQRFPIRLGTTRLGRGEGVDVRILEPGVSRLHAEIETAGRAIELVQRSETNPTLRNGLPVLDRVALVDGDRLQLADRVALRVTIGSGESDVRPGLSQRMERKIDLDREIEEFSVMGSFLDVDVVESRKMKGRDEKAAHIIVSFERFRAYVGRICEEWNGHVLNSNGDELMCFFEDAASALLAGSAILERLEGFNRSQNLLSKPFRFRLGAHTGVSLVDLAAGIAYSEVLDTAGHIQKQAQPDTLLVSQQTLEGLPKRLPLSPAGELTGTGPLYRLDRFLSEADLAHGAD